MNKFKIYPLIKIIIHDKLRFLFINVVILLLALLKLFTYYLNISMVDAISVFRLSNAFLYLALYLIIEMVIGQIILKLTNFTITLIKRFGLLKRESDMDVCFVIIFKLFSAFSFILVFVLIMIYMFVNCWLISLFMAVFLFTIFKFIYNHDYFDKAIRGLGINRKVKLKYDFILFLMKLMFEILIFTFGIFLLYYKQITLSVFTVMTFFTEKLVVFVDDVDLLIRKYKLFKRK
jgi:hypothetical protein